jgi:hypothetical protein
MPARRNTPNQPAKSSPAGNTQTPGLAVFSFLRYFFFKRKILFRKKLFQKKEKYFLEKNFFRKKKNTF